MKKGLLGKSYMADDLIRIQRSLQELDETSPMPTYSKNHKRPVLVKALAKWREVLFEKRPQEMMDRTSRVWPRLVNPNYPIVSSILIAIYTI